METKPINMRLSSQTLELIEQIQQTLHTPNRTQAVVTAVRMCHQMLQILKNGGEIYSENKNGRKERMFLTI